MSRLGCSLPVQWVDSGLHAYPEKLRKHLQETLDRLPPEYKTVLLVFGFCGNSLVGIESKGRTLVLPIVSDCIPLYLGSTQQRERIGNDTYYITEGYLRCENTVVSEHEYYRKRYGDERAKRYSKTILAHYGQLAVIDTGAFEVMPMMEELEAFSQMLQLPIIVVPGNLCILEDLLTRKWEYGKFLKVLPKSVITFEDSLKAGSSQVLIQ